MSDHSEWVIIGPKMYIDALKEAEAECKRFLKRAIAARRRVQHDPDALYGSKETAAVKRASLDVTRAMSDFRQWDKR